MKFRFLIFLFIIPIYTFSQDSIFQDAQTKDDTTALRILSELAWENRSKNPGKAIEYAKRGLSIASKLMLKSKEAEFKNYLGVIYRNKAQYYMGLDYFKEALSLAQQARDSLQIAYAYNNLGGIYRLQANYPLAIEYILHALQYFETVGDVRGAAFCQINIAICYKKLGDYKISLNYLHKTLQIRKKLKDDFGIALTYNHIAEVYFEKRDFTKAEEYYNTALEIYKALDDKKGLSAIYAGKGGINYFNSKYDQALEYRLKALEIDSQIGNIEGKINQYQNIALIYSKMNRLADGKRMLDKAINLSIEIGSLDREMECYKIYSDFYLNLNDYQNSLYYLKKSDEIQDILHSKTKDEMIANFRTKYEMDKKESENRLLKKQLEYKTQNEYLFIVLSLLLFLTASLIYWRYNTNKTLNTKLNKVNALKDKFFYIIAHDLRGPFNSLLGYTDYLLKEQNSISEDERENIFFNINDSSKKIYTLLENLLDWARIQTDSINYNPTKVNLISLIENNLSLFMLQADEKGIKMEFNKNGHEELIINSDEYLLNSIVRNLLNNAIKFTNKFGKIIFDVVIYEKLVSVSISDDGVGISEKELDKLFQPELNIITRGTHNESGTGLGLILCKDFLEIMGGKLEVKSKINEGSKFTFTIPIV
ncbi:MAG: hypothetical protein CVV23_12655 [Ignavibacteriae bacterium HGW-Ignavibacteriae-2]|jgi:signal transduction histidine kinase|nr:MAG: hypothetical protein CVV23_12655 [Ignavibacteriae bacterium HGW-Ignavibacteriae-2]